MKSNNLYWLRSRWIRYLLSVIRKPQQLQLIDTIVQYLHKQRNPSVLKLLFVNHTPFAMRRPRACRRGRHIHIYVPGIDSLKKRLSPILKSAIPAEHNLITSEPIRMRIRCYKPLNRRTSRLRLLLAELGLIRPIGVPDVDNYAKTYMDLLSGIIYEDDRLITDLRIEKYYSLFARVEVTISW